MSVEAPRVLHYLVADDTRRRYLSLSETGIARWVPELDRADKFPDLDLARKARDAYASGYIAVPVVAHG